MPQLSERLPKYRRHKASRQAMVTICGRDYYLGPWKSAESKREYRRLVAEFLARDRQPPPASPGELTVVELLAAYLRYVKKHYRKDGQPTEEVHCICDSLRPVKELYAHTRAVDFGPLALKAVQQRIMARNVVRQTINRRVGRIKRMFKWGVSEQLLPVAVYQALATVEGLRQGSGEARESEGVQPVPDQVVQQTLPHLPPIVADMVRLQRLTAARPAEVCIIRPCDVDTSGVVWAYRPESHKTQHLGRERVIPIGTRGQDVLRPYLLREKETYCFVPTESQRKRYARLRAEAQGRPRHRKRGRFARLGPCYSTASYRRAVHRACQVAGVQRWGPNQLRHSAATKIRQQFGLEAAQVVLGHENAKITQVYAERNFALAAQVAEKIG